MQVLDSVELEDDNHCEVSSTHDSSSDESQGPPEHDTG